MVKLNMTDIPEANIPDGFELRAIRQDEKAKWESLYGKAFKRDSDFTFQSEQESKPGYVGDGVLGIFHGDKLVATGTALCTHEWPEGFVHNIAADSEYSGKKLGYEITAAVLRRLRADGFAKAGLTTDDFRLPAIKSYHKLGFIPVLSVDETMRDRWEKIYGIFGWELCEYR